jgi:hypothetical protein
MAVWQQCPRECTRDLLQPQNLVAFSVFSDECAFYCSAHDRNVFWSKENPNFTQKLEHNPPHVMKRTFERDTAFENKSSRARLDS